MSLIAEFQILNPILEQAVKQVPDIVIEKEDLRSLPNDKWIYVFWASGDDFESLESGLQEDPTVEGFTDLTEVGGRRLYRVTLSNEGYERLVTPIAAKHDIFFLNVEQYHQYARFRARVPTQNALQAYREETRELGLKFQLNRLYREEQEKRNNIGQFGLTWVQQETLQKALEEGLFEVPRQITQEALASQFEVSNQAFSARLRRGLQTLLSSTIGTNHS